MALKSCLSSIYIFSIGKTLLSKTLSITTTKLQSEQSRDKGHAQGPNLDNLAVVDLEPPLLVYRVNYWFV